MLMKRPYANADEALAGARAKHADAEASRVEVTELCDRLRPLGRMSLELAARRIADEYSEALGLL